MDASSRSVTTGPATHLIELYVVERQMVEDYVAYVGYVDAFPEGAGSDDGKHLPRSERALHRMTGRASHTPVVEGDLVCETRHFLPEHPGQSHGLVPGVHVDDGLLALGDQRCHVCVLAIGVPPVLEDEVLAHGRVCHHPPDVQRVAYPVRDIVSRRSGHRQHDGASHPLDHLTQPAVGGSVSRAGDGDVMRLVDHQEAHTSGRGEA